MADKHTEFLNALKSLRKAGRTGLRHKLHWNHDGLKRSVDGWVIWDDSGFSLNDQNQPEHYSAVSSR